MKRVLLLCLMTLLGACGYGGSGGQPAAGTSPTAVQSDNATGKVDVVIKESVAKSVAAAVPTATHLRLVITNPNLNIEGAAFKYIVDGAMPSGSKISGLKFPIAKGYVFELVTYAPLPVGGSSTTVNRMLKYARVANVNVTAADTSIDLALQPITADFTFPTTTVYSGGALGTITSHLPSPTPLQSAWNLFLKADATAAGTALHAVSGQSATHTTLKVPYVLTAGTLYGQGEFYVNSSLLDTAGTLTIIDPTTLAPVSHQAEKANDWTFNYPNPDFGDSIDLVKVPLDVHGLDVNITAQ